MRECGRFAATLEGASVSAVVSSALSEASAAEISPPRMPAGLVLRFDRQASNLRGRSHVPPRTLMTPIPLDIPAASRRGCRGRGLCYGPVQRVSPRDGAILRAYDSAELLSAPANCPD